MAFWNAFVLRVTPSPTAPNSVMLTLWGRTSSFVCWQRVLLLHTVHGLEQNNANTRSTSTSCKRKFHLQLPCATSENVSNFPNLSSHEQQQFTCFFREDQKKINEIHVGSRNSSTRFNIEELKISSDHHQLHFLHTVNSARRGLN